LRSIPYTERAAINGTAIQMIVYSVELFMDESSHDPPWCECIRVGNQDD
jgi:hypothetical protein